MNAGTIAAGIISTLIGTAILAMVGRALHLRPSEKARRIVRWLFRHRLRLPIFVPVPQPVAVAEDGQSVETTGNPSLVSQLEALIEESDPLRTTWPSDESERWRQQVLDGLTDAFGQDSRYYKEFAQLTFGGKAPLTWGEGIRLHYGPEPEEIRLFRQRRHEDFNTARGILKTVVARLTDSAKD